MPQPAYAWAGHVDAFVETAEDELLDALSRYARETGAPQLFAWDRSISLLREEFRRCLPAASNFGLVLEFELPRSGGRRPDLIVLENGIVLVVEFKNRVAVEIADLDQVLSYARALEDYHAGCRERQVLPVLVPIGMRDQPFERDGVRVVPPSDFGALVCELATAPPRARADVCSWVRAPYEPLPSLVEAARLLFERQPLPRIRRAESARIPETVTFLEKLVEEAQRSKRRKLVLVAGVPGSGKTLVGLQLVHSRQLTLPALFVSGNGPLVQVLQYALGGGRPRQEFVQSLHSFLRDTLRRHEPLRERVIVFDEAQRAWDRDRVLRKHHGRLVGSEPELLVRLADRAREEPFVLVAMIGQGQEIHAGEEAGIGQWVDALRASDRWEVVAPEPLAAPFRDGGLTVRTEDLLNLTTTLRSHRASKVARWAEQLLDGELARASDTAADLRDDGFVLYISRDLESLRVYARERYERDPGRRYGLLVSSKFRATDAYGFRPLRSDYWYYGQWYEEGPSHPRSGCRLELAVTEFGCQGLELDLPLLCWGPDLIWTEGGWRVRPGRSSQVRDPIRLRYNAYRVLLTRGRDGLCVFVPPEPAMNATYDALLAAGFVNLDA